MQFSTASAIDGDASSMWAGSTMGWPVVARYRATNSCSMALDVSRLEPWSTMTTPTGCCTTILCDSLIAFDVPARGGGGCRLGVASGECRTTRAPQTLGAGGCQHAATGQRVGGCSSSNIVACVVQNWQNCLLYRQHCTTVGRRPSCSIEGSTYRDARLTYKTD